MQHYFDQLSKGLFWSLSQAESSLSFRFPLETGNLSPFPSIFFSDSHSSSFFFFIKKQMTLSYYCNGSSQPPSPFLLLGSRLEFWHKRLLTSDEFSAALSVVRLYSWKGRFYLAWTSIQKTHSDFEDQCHRPQLSVHVAEMFIDTARKTVWMHHWLL